MSVEALAVVLHHSKAIGTAKLVLLGIANHQGDGGSWPSIATLARYANVDERNVRHAIDKLVETGELTKIQRPGLTPIYRVKVTCPRSCQGGMNHQERADEGPDDDPEPTPTPGATTQGASATPGDSTQGAGIRNPGRQRHPTPGAGAHRTINEPSGTKKKKTPSESSAREPRPNDRGTRIPTDWQPSAATIDWAKKNFPWAGWAEVENFRDYWLAESGARASKRDWDSAWKVWVRRQRPPAQARSTTSERISQVDAAAAQLAATEHAALATVTHLAIEGQPA